MLDQPSLAAFANGLLALAANGALLIGSVWIARDGLRQPRGLAMLLATAVVFWTGCTLGLELLGTFGVLSVPGMAAWGTAVFVVGSVCRWHRGRTMPAVGLRSSPEPPAWDELLCLAATASVALLLGMRSLLLGVKVVSDGPIYHLYFAARWWKAGELILVAAPFGENAATYFPANGDLWFTWLMASWGGERLAKVGQAPFWIIASLAAFGCARALGARRPASVVATCWFATSTPLLLFSFEPNVDTIFVAGYLLAVYFTVQAAQRDWDTAELALAALAAGGSLGTKAVGIVFIPPLALLMIAGIVLGRAGPWAKMRAAMIVGAMTLISGGYWFVRNGLLTGNPLYPLDIRLLGRTVWHGWYGPEVMQTSQYYLPMSNGRALGDILLAVLDPRLVPLWLAAVCVGWAFKGPGPALAHSRRWVALFSLLAVLNVALYWVFIPYRTQQRFMLQALGLAAVPLAMLLDRLAWLRAIAAVLLLLHLLTPECWPLASREGAIPWDMSPLIPNAIAGPIPLFSRVDQAFKTGAPLGEMASLGFLAAIGASSIFMAWSWYRAWVHSPGRLRRAARAIPATVLFLILGYLDVHSQGFDSRLDFYPAFPDFIRGWLDLEARSGAGGVRVAYAGTNIPYYLMARGLRNDVRYVNVDRHRDWLLHDYHREALAHGHGTWPNARPGWDRTNPDFSAWFNNMVEEGIQLLVVTRANPAEGSHNPADSQGFPIERQWAEAHPDRFELLYGGQENDPWFRLYRVRPRVAPGAG